MSSPLIHGWLGCPALQFFTRIVLFGRKADLACTVRVLHVHPLTQHPQALP